MLLDKKENIFVHSKFGQKHLQTCRPQTALHWKILRDNLYLTRMDNIPEKIEANEKNDNKSDADVVSLLHSGSEFCLHFKLSLMKSYQTLNSFREVQMCISCHVY